MDDSVAVLTEAKWFAYSPFDWKVEGSNHDPLPL